MQGEQRYAFNIDRGGTFTDFYVQDIHQQQIIREHTFKVLSQSPEGEGPLIGIRKYLASKGIVLHPHDKIPTKHIQYINIGTTIATNALLEHKGCKNAMLLTEGFGDLLHIRHQARPNIFDLKCERKPILTDKSIEISERTWRRKDPQSQSFQRKIGNQTVFVRGPDEEQLKQVAADLKAEHIDSVGISFCNSYVLNENEERVKKFFQEEGFKHIEVGSAYQDLGYLIRSQTTSLDAFLNPIMKTYFQSFLQEFQTSSQLTLRVMKSNGGFEPVHKVKASSLLLSGPAGGLIGCQSIIPTFERVCETPIQNLICLDMGGTSTDVSRIEDKTFQTKYSFEAEGIEICTPHLEIDTIAAGGGSKLDFQNGMFVVGPESVGSNPGPVCYGVGNELALTDANLVLGRLEETYFPSIFGQNKDEGLNSLAPREYFKVLASKINKDNDKRSIEQIAEGFVDVANELMAKSARKLLTFGTPDALVIFGSAGGQHCCDLAEKIGLSKIFVHKYSGVLSAYGLSIAAETAENKFFLGWEIDKRQFNFEQLAGRVQGLKTKETGRFSSVRYQVGMGYKGTSYTIKVPLGSDLIEVFERVHKKQNGFSLKTSMFRIQYLVETLILQPPCFKVQEKDYQPQPASSFLVKQKEVFIGGKYVSTPVYDIDNMNNCQVRGPALLLSSTSAILLKPQWTAKVTHRLSYIYRTQQTTHAHQQHQVISKPDPIKLTLYSTRLMSIAEQMGKVLQKISISTNIRERLDFSCGIFDWEGKLLANAPHLPVHLGSMETAVREQIKRGIQVGDVILTNHPKAGGSHLPDLTVITCAEIEGTRVYLASRGHHADIGGITPGSMPAFSKKLSEEGVAVECFKLMEGGHFQELKLKELFQQSRRLEDNVSDLLAQMSANEIGAALLGKLISESSVDQFKQYVHFICQNAAQAVRTLLCSFSEEHHLNERDTLTNRQFMDDGTAIELRLTIDRNERSALFDFTGTGPEVLGNTNTPPSITRSAILYCLRSMIGKQMPLNSGCLEPITIIIPNNTILSPSPEAAVVGGNVQTSQKLVDLILKPFECVSCSQGTMNNFLFGTNRQCYYETICGGTGAGPTFNGTTSQAHMTNTRITDIEYLEKVYPVILRQFKTRPNSGGRGQHRGGDGVIREFLFLEEVTVSLLTERRVFGAYGLQGGQPGLVGRNIYITADGVEKSAGGKNTFTVQAGERVRIETPGGGGFGSEAS